MPELPPHLQEVFDLLEDGIKEEKYDLHMPKECEEAGATNRMECEKVMFKIHAPPECVSALENGEFNFDSTVFNPATLRVG